LNVADVAPKLRNLASFENVTMLLFSHLCDLLYQFKHSHESPGKQNNNTIINKFYF